MFLGGKDSMSSWLILSDLMDIKGKMITKNNARIWSNQLNSKSFDLIEMVIRNGKDIILYCNLYVKTNFKHQTLIGGIRFIHFICVMNQEVAEKT